MQHVCNVQPMTVVVVQVQSEANTLPPLRQRARRGTEVLPRMGSMGVSWVYWGCSMDGCAIGVLGL
eukprot:325464-Pyramimonas_sp.AAC.1